MPGEEASLTAEALLWLRNREVAIKLAQLCRENTMLWNLYGQMCRQSALGNFANAQAIRATIVSTLEGLGLAGVGELAIPVIVAGGLFCLMTGSVQAAPKDRNSFAAAQKAYKEYMFKQDIVELKVGGFHLGPDIGPRLSFAQFVKIKYPGLSVPDQKIIINLKW